MMGTFSSSSMYNMIKSAGKRNLSTFTRKFSITPHGCLKDRSAICNMIVVGFASPKFILLNIESGTRLILSPNFQRALPHGERE